MIIYLIGAPGIGKTTVKRCLLKKQGLALPYVFVDPYRVLCAPVNNFVSRFLYAPKRYYTDFLHRLVHFACYRPPTIEERLEAFSKVERKWQPFINTWGRCLADEPVVKMRSIVDQIELLQVRAWLELYCPENACVIMDESLCNRQDFFYNTSVGVRNAREYFRNVPSPDALILLEGGLDLTLNRIEERRARQKWINFHHQSMNAIELSRDTEWAIELAKMCFNEFISRSIPVLSVNASGGPEQICNQILAYLNEEMHLSEGQGS